MSNPMDSPISSFLAYFFAGLTIFAAVLATLLPRTKHALLALWVVGLGVGGIYLSVGAEVLAIIQCIQSTLVTIAFVFFAVMFGEFAPPQGGSEAPPTGARKKVLGIFYKPGLNRPGQNRKDQLFLILSFLLGASFVVVIWLGTQGMPAGVQIGSNANAEDGIHALGHILAQDHLLSLEVLGLTLFLVLIGGGVIARLDRPE